MADEELEEEEIAPKPSRLPLIIGVVVAFLAGGGAGFGASMFLGPSSADAAEGEGEEGAEGEEGEKPKASKNTARAIETLKTFTVNLRGAGGGRVLRMEVQVEVAEDDKETITEKVPVLRDAVLTLVSDYTYADLEGLDGKTRLRDELHARLNAVLDGPKVERVFFTQFVVQ